MTAHLTGQGVQPPSHPGLARNTESLITINSPTPATAERFWVRRINKVGRQTCRIIRDWSEMIGDLAVGGLILSCAALYGCSDRLKDEQTRLAIVKDDGDKDAICTQSRKLADAALAEKDSRYGQLISEARANCSDAKIEAADLNRKAEALADNLIAQADRASAQ